MKKFENFCAALANLEDIYKYEEPYENVVLTGLVALYEICFEQSWKAMKEVLQSQGFPEGQTGSPRQILKTAYQAGMLRDEKLWLDALVSRNNVTHAYNQAVALDIVKLTKTRYYHMFHDLKKEMERNWLSESEE
ncbi:MAG: HI0074 family nucleotidyltransferase substrate-binding subunit [Clostridiales bacterium]|nr:HI0074 family nucleotidyltransferase substrate-binding subunit [Clostridiales bacterium]